MSLPDVCTCQVLCFACNVLLECWKLEHLVNNFRFLKYISFSFFLKFFLKIFSQNYFCGFLDWGSPGVGVRAGDNFGYAFVAPMRGGSLNAVEIDADRFVSKTLRSQKGKEGIRVLSRVSGDLILSAGDTVVLMATSEAPLRTLSADPTYDCAAKCADANNTAVIGSDSWCDCCLHLSLIHI